MLSRTHRLMVLGVWLLLVGIAAAAPPYKALIVTGQNGHDWQGTTPVLWSQLAETGLFTVDVATSPPKGSDMSGFKPQFDDYDVVISNYQGDEWPEETKEAFVQYVANGGGLVVYHFACAAFPNWPEYNEIIGLGGWGRRNEKWGPMLRLRDGKWVEDMTPHKGGGHGPMQPFQMVVYDSDHPITRGLPKRFMHVDDELYGWLRGPAKNLRVLASAYAPADKGGSDEHEPLLFTVQYGKGRVVQWALGHTPNELKSVAFLAPFQRCAEWAASGEVTQEVPDDFPTADKATTRD
jgi:type 1 glutamine amidotransferase